MKLPKNKQKFEKKSSYLSKGQIQMGEATLRLSI